jgi:hypothetical protein
VDENINA